MADISLWTTEQYLKLPIYVNKKNPNGSDSDISPQPRIQFSKLSVVSVLNPYNCPEGCSADVFG